MSKMKWCKLLNYERLEEEYDSEELRSEFERDADRVIFSWSFKRLNLRVKRSSSIFYQL